MVYGCMLSCILVLRVLKSVVSVFSVNAGMRQGYHLAPLFFNTCLGRIEDTAIVLNHCRITLGNMKVTDPVFAYDFAILVLETQVAALKAISTEAKPFSL